MVLVTSSNALFAEREYFDRKTRDGIAYYFDTSGKIQVDTGSLPVIYADTHNLYILNAAADRLIQEKEFKKAIVILNSVLLYDCNPRYSQSNGETVATDQMSPEDLMKCKREKNMAGIHVKKLRSSGYHKILRAFDKSVYGLYRQNGLYVLHDIAWGMRLKFNKPMQVEFKHTSIDPRIHRYRYREAGEKTDQNKKADAGVAFFELNKRSAMMSVKEYTSAWLHRAGLKNLSEKIQYSEVSNISLPPEHRFDMVRLESEGAQAINAISGINLARGFFIHHIGDPVRIEILSLPD